jgi:hypothetical protein
MSRFGSHKQNSAHLFSEADRKKCFVGFGLISSYEKSRIEVAPNVWTGITPS